MNFKKSPVKGSLDLPAKNFLLDNGNKAKDSQLVSHSTKEKSLFAEISNKEANEDYEKKIEEMNYNLIENSSLMYSCLTSYVGYYFSENETDKTTNSILNKCLQNGKVNYPDLFLRFMD